MAQPTPPTLGPTRTVTTWWRAAHPAVRGLVGIATSLLLLAVVGGAAWTLLLRPDVSELQAAGCARTPVAAAQAAAKQASAAKQAAAKQPAQAAAGQAAKKQAAAGQAAVGQAAAGGAKPAQPAAAAGAPGAAGANAAAAKPGALTPAQVTVNVYNATTRVGLAHKVGSELRQRGFKVVLIDNDPLARSIPGVAELRRGPAGEAAAATLLPHLGSATALPDGRGNATVDVVLGARFTALRDRAAAAAPFPGSTRPQKTC